MKYDNLKVGSLEERFSLRLLLALKSEQPIVKGDLHRLVAKGMSTTLDRLDSLEKIGLVKVDVEAVKPFRKFMQLTPMGMRIAEHLQAIEDELEQGPS